MHKFKETDESEEFYYPPSVKSRNSGNWTIARDPAAFEESHESLPKPVRPYFTQVKKYSDGGFKKYKEHQARLRQEALDKIFLLQGFDWLATFADRIKSICDEADEFPDETKPITVDTLLGCLEFLKLSGPLVRPSISATSDGALWLEWRKDKDHITVLEPRTIVSGNFVIFCDDREVNGAIARSSGSASYASILKTFEENGAFSWMKRD